MTSLAARRGRRWLITPRAESGFSDWSDELPKLTREEVDRIALETFRRRLGKSLPGRLAEQIEAALDDVFLAATPTGGGKGLSASLVPQSGEPMPFVLWGAEVRIGSGASCQLQIPAASGADENRSPISEEHCELRRSGSDWSLTCLGHPPGTLLNGSLLPANEPHRLHAGDELKIGGYTIVFGETVDRSADPGARIRFLEYSGHWRRAESSPFLDFGTVDDHWIPVRIADWRGFLKLPDSWLGWSYAALGLEAPESALGFHSEIDRSVTKFVLAQVAARLRARLGQPVEIGSISKGASIALGSGAPGEIGYMSANVDLFICGVPRETCLVWPVRPQPRAPRGLGSSWQAKVPFGISVLAGFTVLQLAEYRQLEVGDVIFPDRWLPQADVETDQISGEVLAFLQQCTRPAELFCDDGRVGLRWTTDRWEAGDWERESKGANMLPDETEGATIETAGETPGEENRGSDTTDGRSPHQTLADGRRLEDDLQVAVTFELDRLTVPLVELTEWEAGTTISLARKPNDPVRIVLQHAGGERRLGSGRVVVVDGELGIQIEDWIDGSGPASLPDSSDAKRPASDSSVPERPVPERPIPERPAPERSGA